MINARKRDRRAAESVQVGETRRAKAREYDGRKRAEIRDSENSVEAAERRAKQTERTRKCRERWERKWDKGNNN